MKTYSFTTEIIDSISKSIQKQSVILTLQEVLNRLDKLKQFYILEKISPSDTIKYTGYHRWLTGEMDMITIEIIENETDN